MQRMSPLRYAACRPTSRLATKRRLFSLRSAPTPSALRPISHSTCVNYPRKDSQDKDSINTEATEYSKSGTDDASARQDNTAFDPSTTDPGEQKDNVGEQTGVSTAINPGPLRCLLRRFDFRPPIILSKSVRRTMMSVNRGARLRAVRKLRAPARAIRVGEKELVVEGVRRKAARSPRCLPKKVLRRPSGSD